MRSSFATFAAALLALLCATAGQAQTLTLSPAVVPLKGSLGQSVTQTLTLRNDTDQTIDFVLEAKDVVVREGARVFVEAGMLPGSVAAGAVFTPRTLRVAPRASGSASVTLTLPQDMRHRAVIAFVRSTTPVKTGGRQAGVSLGTLFTFQVSDEVSVAMGALKAEPPSATANTRLLTTLANDGKEPVTPSAMAVILDAAGQLAGKVPFPPKRLLPGERATLEAEYPGDLEAGRYRVVATFDVAGKPQTLTGSLLVP